VNEPLEKVARTLVGDPVGGTAGQGTLIAFVQADEAPVATLTFLPSRDDGLVVFRHWVDAKTATLDVISDFSKQKKKADLALKAAKKLAAGAPGRAIQELRNVANAFPFEEAVRDEALTLASKLEGEAIANQTALEDALGQYRIYRSDDALQAMETLSTKLDALYLGEASRGGSLETEIQELVTQVREARKEHDVELALPGVDRLERIAVHLSDSEGWRPLAAVYWRSMLHRYEKLMADAPDIARRLKSAKEQFDALKQDENVKSALPPIPEAK